MVTVVVCDDGVTDYAIESSSNRLVIVRFNPDKRGVARELGSSARLSYAFINMLRIMANDSGGLPDVIESQDYLGIAYYLQQFKLLGYLPFAGIPVLVTMHAPAFVYLPYNRVPMYRFPEFWTGEMEKQSIRAADMVVSPSKFLVAEVGRHMDYGPRTPVVLRYPYEPCGRADGKASGVGEAGDAGGMAAVKRNKIVYYGKLSPQKGSFELLEYFRDLWEGGFPHALRVIGGTDIVYQPEQQTMGQVIRRRYAAYIRRGLLLFHGKIEPAGIEAALADAHVVVLPSIVDNLPFACLEVMGCGKIVLASVQGGQREIIRHGENGFLFDHTIAGDFEEKLLGVLALGDAEADRIMENARRTLELYSYSQIAPLKIALLEKLIAGHKPADRFPFLRQEPVTRVPPEAGIAGLLSVVIPFYNLGAYLDDCIASVLGCSWRRLEVVLVNDGSTDAESVLALDKWREQPEVTVIDLPNRGLAAARNAGAERARGRFLAFLDADDKVRPDYYEKAIGVLTWYDNVHFVGCWVRYFGGGAGIWPAFLPAPPYLLTHNPVNSSGLVYKKASFLAGGTNDRRLEYGLEDYESVVSMVSRGFNGVVLPEALHLYRVRRGSMIRRMNRTRMLNAHGYIVQKHQAFYQQFAAEVVQLLNSNGPGYLFENPTTEVFVRSSWIRPRSWRAVIRRLAGRNSALKVFLLAILKKTEHLWQKQ